MSNVVIERHFKQAPEIVFKFISQTEFLLKWWGPEGVTIADHSLNFSLLGPWYSEMQGSEGQRYFVSGEVMSIDEPNSIELTWAWDDDDGNRGHESHVRFDVLAADQGGTFFKLTHSGLKDAESAQNHNGGWTSSLNRLENSLN